MFIQLFKLCRRITPTGKTPLEDFTTESFVGLLNLYPQESELRKEFIEFLGLPEGDDYHIESQREYTKCRIDIVVESAKKNILCFIESKVESKENKAKSDKEKSQLEKYCELLNNLKSKSKDKKLNLRLRYLTKYHEPKDKLEQQLKGDLSEIEFKTKRWFEVADFLTAYESNQLVNNTKSNYLIKDFLTFLKSKNMSKDLKFSNEDFQIMESMSNTAKILNNHLDRVDKDFYNVVGKRTIQKDSIEKLAKFNRWAYYVPNIVEDKKASDFKYGFYFDDDKSRIYMGVYIEKESIKYLEIEQLESISSAKEFEFELRKDGDKIHGLAIKLERDITDLREDEEGPDKIQDWFKASFKEFHKFFQETNTSHNIGWKIKELTEKK